MCYFSIFITGLVFGSFVNVCVWRIPREQSIIKPRSYCRSCRKTVKWYDNIPILSWIILLGRCRYCGSKISVEYPLTEFLTGLIFLLIYNRFSRESFIVLVMFLLYGLLLIVISGIDLHHRIIPDILSYSMMAAGVLFSPFNTFLDLSLPEWFRMDGGMPEVLSRLSFSVFSMVAAGVILWLIAVAGEKIFKKEAMGGGDIKLIAAIGACVGIVNVLWVIFLASFIGGIAGLILIMAGKKKRLDTIPFGPYISIGAFVVILFQPFLNQWYQCLVRY